MKKDFSKTKKIVNIMCIVSVSLFVLALIIFFASGSNKSNQKAEEIITNGEEKVRFSLNGDKVVKLYVGDTYVDSGFSLTGSSQDLRKYVSVKNEVDTTTKGKYKVTYTFNYNGITSQLVRQVVVYDEFMIKLKGSETFHVAKGTTFEDPGAVAKDPIDGDISDQIKVEGKVNSNNLGTYTLTYSVTNSSGKEAQAVRTVIVYEMNFTLTLLSSDYTSGDRVIEFKTDSPYYNYVKLPNGETNMGTTIQYKVTNNGSYTFSICDAKEICIDKTITVNNIDRVAPEGSCSGYYKNGKSVVTIKATDNVGVDRYAIDGYVYNVSTITLDKERTSVQVKIYDKAGNSRTISCNLENKNTTSGGSTGGNTGGSTGGNTGGGNTGGATGGGLISGNAYGYNYFVNVPSNISKNPPLILFLHGDGEVGSPAALRDGYFMQFVRYSYSGEPFIFLAPNTVVTDWSSSTLQKNLKSLTDSVANAYNVDKSRIYIIGTSRGAIGTWGMLSNYPGYFSAAVPISCCAPGYFKIANLKSTKVRAISGTSGSQESGYNSCMTNYVNQLNQLGGYAIKETHSGATHGTILSKIDFNDVFKWLLSN